MSENCSNDCSSCGVDCESRKAPMKEPLNESSSVKRVIGIVSGKGGVGKSLVTGLMASGMSKRGKRAAVLDADITGPSIPKIFGLHGGVYGTEKGIVPKMTESGIQVMSTNFMLENENDPVVWRGPVIAGVIKQFWTEVVWEDVDFMFVDMPPGTGDVPLTVFQSLPVDGIIIVTSPQELVGLIVEKAVRMANMMDVPILGIVENMSYFECPGCGERHEIFGSSHVEELAKQYGIGTIARLPVATGIPQLCDAGEIEKINGDWLDGMLDVVEKA